MSDLIAAIDEARRGLEICNACRYCEGYCPVFPALERGGVGDSDVLLLANVCHDCRACYQACMYAPPHEFALDLPASLTAVRTLGYRELARPRILAGLMDRPYATQLTALGIGLLLTLGTAAVRGTLGSHRFYAVFPADLMTGFFLVLSLIIGATLGASALTFWRAGRRASLPNFRRRAVARTVRDVALMRHLSGGGPGCFHSEPERPSGSRRTLHQLVMYGFLATFAATIAAATEQHLLGLAPPYPALSAPVVLGTSGGVAVIAGSCGFIAINHRARVARALTSSPALGSAFLGSLLTVSITGVLLLTLRASAVMPALLGVHLGAVTAFYLTLPYSKFVHATHRFTALVIDQLDQAAGLSPEFDSARSQNEARPNT